MSVVLDNLDVYLKGMGTTAELTLLSFAVALVLGTLVAAARVSPVPPLRAVGPRIPWALCERGQRRCERCGHQDPPRRRKSDVLPGSRVGDLALSDRRGRDRPHRTARGFGERVHLERRRRVPHPDVRSHFAAAGRARREVSSARRSRRKEISQRARGLRRDLLRLRREALRRGQRRRSEQVRQVRGDADRRARRRDRLPDGQRQRRRLRRNRPLRGDPEGRAGGRDRLPPGHRQGRVV